jgi:hypothetical protein
MKAVVVQPLGLAKHFGRASLDAKGASFAFVLSELHITARHTM